MELTAGAAINRRGRWPAGQPAPRRSAGADGRRTARRHALVTTERRHGGSSHCAQMATGDSGRPSFAVQAARSAGPLGNVPSRLETIAEARADRNVTQQAPHCPGAGTWTSQAGRPSCPRRFVVILRSRQREDHGRRGLHPGRRADLPCEPDTPAVAPGGGVAVSFYCCRL